MKGLVSCVFADLSITTDKLEQGKIPSTIKHLPGPRREAKTTRSQPPRATLARVSLLVRVAEQVTRRGSRQVIPEDNQHRRLSSIGGVFVLAGDMFGLHPGCMVGMFEDMFEDVTIKGYTGMVVGMIF